MRKSWISNLVRRFIASDKPRGRLSSAEAIHIAGSHANDGEDAQNFQTATLVDRDGKKIWVVSESAIGNVAFVEIDDETGVLLKKGRLGIR